MRVLYLCSHPERARKLFFRLSSMTLGKVLHRQQRIEFPDGSVILVACFASSIDMEGFRGQYFDQVIIEEEPLPVIRDHVRGLLKQPQHNEGGLPL